MKKRLIIVTLVLASMVILPSCGNKYKNLDQEFIDEMEEGMDDEDKEEYEEFLKELDEEIENNEKEQEKSD